VTRITRMCTGVFVVAMAVALGAQETTPAQEKTPEKQAASPSRPALVPLKIQLVLSRYQGEKKISSVPYAFAVLANAGSTRLRMGSQIPLPIAGGGTNYKDVGTNIDAIANTAPDNYYRVDLTVTDSSVYFPDRSDPAPPSGTSATGAPAFRTFTSNFSVLLRDGQSGQHVSATDQVTGQVLKLDTTLNVVK
jgi:hypothetical protein